MELFPADNIDCDAMLESLSKAGFIDRYEHAGKRYLHIVNFDKHQNPHKDEKASTVPDQCGHIAAPDYKPKKHGASTVQAPCEHEDDTVANVLIPDSRFLIPDPLLLAAEQPQPKSEKQKAARLPKNWVLPKSWGQWTIDELGWDELSVRREAEKFRDFWIAKGGRDAAKLDWEATWRNWCRNAKVSTAGSGASLLAGGI
jgi:hypothetical protein